MKKISKYPLVIFALVSLIIIAVSALVVGICGVRTSIEIGGGSQIEVTMSYDQAGEHHTGRENTQEYVGKVKSVLAKHDAFVDSYFVEDKLVDTYLVVRIAKSEIAGATDIKAEIATELGIDASRVSDVQVLTASFSNNTILFITLGIVAMVVVCFFIGWLRYGLVAGVTLLLAVLHNFILSFATIFLCRIQLSMIALCSIIAMSVLSVFALICILEREKENLKSKQYAELTPEQSLWTATKQSKWLISIFAIAGIVSLLALVIPINYIRFAGLAGLIITIVSVYTAIGICPALQALFVEISNTRQKQRLSKNQPVKVNNK